MLRNLCRGAVLAITAAAAAPTGGVTPPAVATNEVVDTLLAGGDARAAIAQRREQAPVASPARQDASRGALAAYARQLADIDRVIAAAREGRPGVRESLAAALTALRAQRLLVEARLDAVAVALAGRNLVAQRWQQRRAPLDAYLRRVDDAVRAAETALAKPGKTAAMPHAVLAELADLAAANANENAPAIYGADLPVRRVRLPARAPTTTPAAVPAYAIVDDEVAPVAADFAGSAEAPLSDAIVAKAASLGYDYTRILDFVRSQVRTQWYAGSQKGAEATLRTLSGNDVDQASLLIALLRAAHAPARYVRGVLEVPVADLAASLGVRSDKVGQALGAAGVAHEPVARGGRLAAYAIEHVYVTAKLPLSNYRGSAADLEGATWLPLAPALKPYAFTPARGALAAAGVAPREFVDAYIAAAQTQPPLDALRERVSQALARQTPPLAYADQLARRAVDAPPLELLPASLPAVSVAVTGEFAELPDTLRQRLHVIVRDERGDVALDAVIALSELADRRLTLGYEPASIEDGRIADRRGGMASTPPSLIRLRPVLNVAGLPLRHGTGDVESGAQHQLEIRMESSAGSAAFEQELTAGGLAALVLDAQGDGLVAQPDGTNLPGESESPAARLLWNLGARYLAAWDEADDELARLVGVGVVRPFPSAVLVINRYAVTRVAGVVDAMTWEGVAMDAALRPAEAFAGVAGNRAEADWTELSGLHGSALEHVVFEQQWAVDSVSADKGLALAAAQHIPVLQLSSATGIAALNQPAAVKDAIAAWLARGYVVDVPRDPVTYQAWTGATWRVRDLATGESGWFIAGGLAGGATAMPSAAWYLQDLVALLGEPYGKPANEDPLSAAILTLDRDTQNQEGEAGTLLAKPLRAFVLDETGRPVKGAQVTFSVASGNAKLIGVDGSEGASATVTTDARGAAVQNAKLDTSTGNLGIYRMKPGDIYPQFIGISTVNVIAQRAGGTLVSGEEFRLGTVPGEAARIAFAPDPPRDVDVGIGRDWMTASVEDRYGNRIANADLSLHVSTNYGEPSCQGSGTQPPIIDAALSEAGRCPADLLLSGSCGTSPLQLKSQSLGTPFELFPPNAAPAKITLSAASGSLSKRIEVKTSRDYDYCSSPIVYMAFNQFIPASLGGPSGVAIGTTAAAPPGQIVPGLARIEAFEDDRAHRSAGLSMPKWRRLDGIEFDFRITNGSAENLHTAGPGVYAFDLRAGPKPGPIWFAANFYLPGRGGYVEPFVLAWAVDLRAPLVEPSRIGLTPFGVTETELSLNSSLSPSDYFASPQSLELLENGEVAETCTAPVGGAGFYCRFWRGMPIDANAQYTARSVLNDGTPYRMQSEETPINFGRGIVAGFGMLPRSAESAGSTLAQAAADAGGGDLLDLIKLVQGNLPRSLTIRQDIDVPTGYACEIGAHFGYLLSQPATVSLRFYRLDAQGDPSPIEAWRAIDDEARPEGLNGIDIQPARLGPGEYLYELKATAADGKVETYTGVAGSTSSRTDALPLAHTIVKGVDVHSGSGSIGETDIDLGGRGPGLHLARTYASHQGGGEPGFFGRGWSADLDNQVRVTTCGQRIVTGAAGQGQRFRASGRTPDDAQTFEPLHGYHGTLVQQGGEYDFYTRDGTRYHYGEADLSGPRLSYIEDTSGNRVTYIWSTGAGGPRVTQMADGAGRRIDLTYATRVVERASAGVTIRESFDVVVGARGPDGLDVKYEYDDAGNLVRVTRGDAGGKGTSIVQYDYRNYGGVMLTQPDGETTWTQFGHRLAARRDALRGSARRYVYELGWSVVPYASSLRYEPEQRVTELTEPDGGKTLFAYDGVRGSGAVGTKVKDARQNETAYALNRYGAAERITDAAGTTTMEWDFAALQPKTQTDALGTVTNYTYDAHGNTTREEVVHASGRRARSWTFVPPAAFEVPYIKNRPDTYTDAREILTDYTYDAPGNLVGVTRGGVTEANAYAANGDRTSHTDGTGKVWNYRYDAYGYVKEGEDPLGNVVTSEYDARGRQVRLKDANGRTTSWTYDARDRPLKTTYPSTDAGDAVETTLYDDRQGMLVRDNPRGIRTLVILDAMGRRLTESSAGTMLRWTYDANGNLLTESDRENHQTSYEYDAANRLSTKREPLGRTTTYTVDALGHVLSETTGERTTNYRYDDPGYRRTSVQRALSDAAGTSWVQETSRYDANGNAVESIDAEGRTTTRTFDDRDRLTLESAPLGRVTRYAYDGAGRKTSETHENPGGSGTQVRRFSYDAAGRRTSTTDAEGGVRKQGYDGVGNVTSRTDARGNVTRLAYDARNNLVEQIGPEAGQRVQYRYDLNSNKTGETWANGRELIYEYDALDRRTRTKDGEGDVETRKLDGDGLVTALTDADGRRTSFTYDALHHPLTKTLPGAGARTIATVYNIHGDLLAETDPRSNTMSHTYDTLGRRVTTSFPAVHGVTATQRMTYDKVGNVLSETNGRNQKTTYTVNALNQRETQTDPETDGATYTQSWTYDAQGNALTHVDRRGVLSVTAYDKENRPIGHTRDGLILDTLTLDAEGNVERLRDAEGRETKTAYDKANRKIRVERPLGATESWAYTAEGDVATATDADERVTRYTYTKRRYRQSESLAGETTNFTVNGIGQTLSRQRPNGKTWRYGYDPAGRLSMVTDPLDHVTTFGYDDANNRTSVKDANQHTTTFAYDERNRLAGKAYPGNAAYAWTHDADGNVTGIDAPNGRTTSTTYDALNRARISTYSNPLPNEVTRTERRYDGNANVVTIVESGNGARTETRRYDPFDRVEAVTNAQNRKVVYGYDEVGNRTQLTDHDDAQTTWRYDDLNRNEAITVPGQGTTRQTHTKAGKLEMLTRPDGSTTTHTYDEAGRIATIVHEKGGQLVAKFAYRYDLNGNRIEQRETNGATTNNTEVITTYRYDDADRLVQVIEPTRKTDYELDAVGNRTKETVTTNGTVTSRSILKYNARDQLIARDDDVANVHVTQTYDDNGNLITQTNNGVLRSYTYDARDRMLSLKEGTNEPLTFDYDANGLRLEKTQGSQSTKYQYDQGSLLAETNTIGNTLARYHYSATQLISETKAGTTPTQRHYLLDALRSPIALLTQQGAVSARTRYDAWGEVVAQQGTDGQLVAPARDTATASLPKNDGQPIGFTGYIKDSESGLYYAKARYYDPAVARFTTEDPEAGKDMEPPSLHRYLYAYANPTVNVDPTGRESVDIQMLRTEGIARATDPVYKAKLQADYNAEEIRRSARNDEVNQRITSTVKGVGETLATAGWAVLESMMDGDIEYDATNTLTTGVSEGVSDTISTVAHPIDRIYNPIREKLNRANELDAQGQTYIAETLRQGALLDTTGVALGVAGAAGSAKALLNGVVTRAAQKRAIESAIGRDIDRDLAGFEIDSGATPSTVLESANGSPALATVGANASYHQTERLWTPNPGGARTMAQARQIAEENGVFIDDDIHFSPVKDGLYERLHGNSYATFGFYRDAGPMLPWRAPNATAGGVADVSGRINVFVRQSVLASDRAITAVLGHEAFEIEALRVLFQAAGGALPREVYKDLTRAGRSGTPHWNAVDYGDELVRRMIREGK